MKPTLRACLQTVFAAVLCLAAGTVSAHPLHGASLFEGLAHPFLGLDHLLAMTAVGAWAQQQGGRWRWAIPAGFLAAMAAGALAAAVGVLDLISASTVESMVAASVLVIGVLVATQTRQAVAGAAVVAAFALFHGAAHMAEAQPGATSALYALGFLAATAALHGVGLFAGAALMRAGAVRWAGAGVAVTGLWLLQSAA
jgi:urease accessory protein